MASKKKKAAAAAGGAAGAAKAAKNSPYVQEIVENDELRDNITAAYESARDAYDRIASSKKPAKAVFDDKKLQRDLKTAADSIKDAGLALKNAPSGAKKAKAKKKGGLGRKLLILTVAAGLALALSEDLRKKVLDALFGAEEEFEYTSTSTPAGGGATGGVTTPAGSTT
jgi:hypothetical protein